MIYILSLSLFSVYISLTKFKVWSPVSFFSIFLFLQLLLYFLFLNDFVPVSAYTTLPLPYDLIGNNKKETLNFYFVLLIFFIILILLYKKETFQKSNITPSDLVNNIPNGFLTLMCALLFFSSLNYFLDMNFSNILEHSEYLDAVNPKKMGLENTFSLIYHNSIFFIGCFSILFFILCKKKNLSIEKNVSLLISIFIFLILLGRGSRGTLFVIIFYAMCDTIILNKKINKVALSLYILICIQLFFTVIGIRSAQSGGLIHIVPAFFNLSAQKAFDNFFLIYQNTCFGIINFDISLNYQPNHSSIHKFLSNSPLLSIMDGFREISEEFIYRINIFTPFSSYVESYHFGIFYVIYFCLLQIFNIYWVSIKVNGANFLFYLPATLFSNLSIIYATQYSVRTSTKFIFLSYIFFFIANYYLNKNSKNNEIVKK